jgi:hypothetical protein
MQCQCARNFHFADEMEAGDAVMLLLWTLSFKFDLPTATQMPKFIHEWCVI